jgi:peptide/nickel transport system permease protein
VVVVRHAVRNSLIPVITIITGQIPVMIGGAVIMEQIFSLPGMGRLFLDSINRRDYPFVSGINIMLATIGMVLILLTDMSYAWLDPRVRYR